MKRIEIVWQHLESSGTTCARCSETGQALDVVIEQLAEECRPEGWEIIFNEIKLTEKELDKSNAILINGTLLEDILPNSRASKSHCPSCCDFTGNSQTCCRTVEFGGKSYETIPAALIKKAVCRVAQCC